MAGDGECHDCSCGWKQPVEPEVVEVPVVEETMAQRYEAYWQRNHMLDHHEFDCPNPDCDHRLKARRPAKGSGEMWDSLAECPYCNGIFFYESRPLRIDVSFKGKLERL
jgi:hypothetical protein